MAESTPPSRAPLEEDERVENDSPSRPSGRNSRPLRLIDAPMRLSSPSHPPSEPRPIASRPGADAAPDRPARVQLIAALLLLLVLVVVPLYLWRRPRAATPDDSKAVASAAAPPVVLAATASAEPPPRSRNGVTLGDAKIVGCHDPGPKHTAADQCDRLPGLEAAFAKAILDASSCVPPGTPGGTIAFLVDASYGRHHNPVRVRHRHDDTTLPGKAVTACVADVRRALAPSAMDATHAHSRYEIEIDATYAAKN